MLGWASKVYLAPHRRPAYGREAPELGRSLDTSLRALFLLLRGRVVKRNSMTSRYYGSSDYLRLSKAPGGPLEQDPDHSIFFVPCYTGCTVQWSREEV
jgi:hypothetical protein